MGLSHETIRCPTAHWGQGRTWPLVHCRYLWSYMVVGNFKGTDSVAKAMSCLAAQSVVGHLICLMAQSHWWQTLWSCHKNALGEHANLKLWWWTKYTLGSQNCSSIRKAYNKTIKAWLFRVTSDLSVLACGLVAKNSALGLVCYS